MLVSLDEEINKDQDGVIKHMVLFHAVYKNGRNYKINSQPASKASAEEGMHQRNNLTARGGVKYSVTR